MEFTSARQSLDGANHGLEPARILIIKSRRAMWPHPTIAARNIDRDAVHSNDLHHQVMARAEVDSIAKA